MKKEIRNKVLIVLAGLSFIGITAGVGIGLQRSALSSSYLAQFDNDKSETKLNPPINDADLVAAISNFSLKPEWSKISASQAFKLHNDKLYAFKLSQAVDFSKVDNKFSNLFFDIQVTEETKVESNSIKNLTVFVFDKKTKKEVASRAFTANLFGFSAIAKEDFLENFIAESSKYNLDKSQLTKKFASDSIFPSAFALKFQDQLLTNLRKISPEIFDAVNKTPDGVAAGVATQFQQGGGGGGTGSGEAAGGSGGAADGATGDGASNGTGTGAQDGASGQPGSNQPSTPETPKVETAPKAPEVPLVSKLKPTNPNLELALKQTLESFGGLELIAASGLQSLIPNEYTLLPVTSEKSLVKIDIDDAKGTAKIWLKLLDKSNKEKLIGLEITGLSSVESIKDKIFAKINKNQNKYISLKPQVAEYFRKNPNQSIAKLISDYQTRSSAAGSKVAEVLKKYLESPDLVKKAIKGEFSVAETKPTEQGSGIATTTGTSDGETQNELQKKLVELSKKDPKVTADFKNYLKEEYNIDLPEDSTSSVQQPTAVQASVAASSATEVQVQVQVQQPQQQQPQQQQPQEQQQEIQSEDNRSPRSSFSKYNFAKQQEAIELVGKDKDFYVPYFEIYNYQLPTIQSEGKTVLVTPDQLDFWFETKDNLKVDNYNFDFSLDQNQDEKSTDKTLKLNVNFKADSNFKLEVSPKNVPFLDVSEAIEQPKDQTSEPKAVNVAIEATPKTPEKDHSSYKFKGFTYPITINTEGSKVQNELEKLVGNNHQGTLNNSLPYLLFQSDLDSIFKTAKLDSWFSLSDSDKNNAKAYLKSTLNPITNEMSLQKPKVEAAPTPAPAPANPTPPAPTNPPADSGSTASNPPAVGSGSSTAPAAGSDSGSTGSAASGASGGSSNSSSATSSSTGSAATTSSSVVVNNATAFQDPATPAPEKEETFAFGDYLINYLDKFEKFNKAQGQKLAISSQYDAKNRSYNFVFEVLDSDNDTIASSTFGLVGVNKNNTALKTSLAYSPDVFIDGSSGLDFHAHEGQSNSILTNVSSTKTSFQYKVNNFTDNSALDKLLQENGYYNQRAADGKGITIKQPLVYDFDNQGSVYEFDGNTKGFIKTRGRQVEKSTLQEGVMYFVFKPENNLVDSEKLVEQSYKLLSTAPEAKNGSFGASYLELFRTVDDNDGSKDNKAKRISSILNLGWRVEKARSLAIDKNQISTTEHNYQTKGLVVFRDTDPVATDKDPSKLYDYGKQTEESLDKGEHQKITESKKLFDTGTTSSTGTGGVAATGAQTSPAVKTEDVNEIFKKFIESKSTDGQGQIYQDGIWFNHTRPSQNVSLESFLNKTWILEVRIDKSSVTFSLIAQREPNQEPYVWTSQLQSIYKDAKQNINPDTPIGVMFGRGIDYSQIGDRIISDLDSSGKDREGITFKALAVFKGEKMAKDDKARLEIRKAFIDQYFK
ncbi:P110/LppT family adhesin N-terminal domain [Mesomycoplasma ovipneumoniae]|uniref:P110/LppT family adhesin N-terminal domain n=1 Tax=Mesomycoplasma ovipneumoniae TaxID=29562 RepID=A0AAP5Y1Q7_9BACT|nr:P110/LppT family adhesin N-terminal domain [Mesomycoplasma ovipneumoniae]MDW2916037.1 P110/LppT family adhesin N-terminal domain [Mesomycoplasma ovipneumoniae]